MWSLRYVGGCKSILSTETLSKTPSGNNTHLSRQRVRFHSLLNLMNSMNHLTELKRCPKIKKNYFPPLPNSQIGVERAWWTTRLTFNIISASSILKNPNLLCLCPINIKSLKATLWNWKDGLMKCRMLQTKTRDRSIIVSFSHIADL